MPYVVHNTARSRTNRMLRAASPGKPGMKQYIGGEHRLVRGRPVTLTDDQFAAHLEELRSKSAAGAVEVFTTDGRKVDLTTLEAGPSAPVPPLPNPPLDSIQNDKPAGQFIPQMPGGEPEMSQPGTTPKLPDLVAGAPSEETELEEGAEEDVPATDSTGKGKKNKKR